MKRFISTITFAFLFLVLAVSTPAQISSQKTVKTQTSYQYTLQGSIDTLAGSYDTLWTRELGISDFDAVGTFTYRSKATPTAGNPKYSIELFYSWDNVTYTKVDTVLHQSTNNGVVWGVFTPGSPGTIGIAAPYWKFAIFQVAAGRDDAAIRFDFYSNEADNGYVYGVVR